MQYSTLDGITVPVSRIILGGSSAPMWKGQNCDELLDEAYRLGITTFDTARGYGESEKVLAKWVKDRGLQGKVLLQTKGGLHGLLGNNRIKKGCLDTDLATSLAVMAVDKIDLYILHRDNPRFPVGTIVEWLNEYVAQGKVVRWGVSNWTAQRIEQANEYAYAHGMTPISISQPHYSLAEAGVWTWIGCHSITGKNAEQERQWYAETQMPAMAFSPLAGGLLSGKVSSQDYARSKKNIIRDMRITFGGEQNRQRLARLEQMAEQKGCTVAQLALAWLLNSPINTFVIVGNTRVASLRKSVEAVSIPMTQEERAYLDLQTDIL